MATTPDSVSSPRFRPNSSKNLSSPWANIVRGESESSILAAPSSPSSSSSSVAVAVGAMAPKEQMMDSDSVKGSTFDTSEGMMMIQPEGSDNGGSNAARGKKPAWNKPSNGTVEVSPVMGAVSWPALSESAKASPKSSSDSLKTLPDGSVAVSQAPVIASVPQKQVNVNANPSSTPNHPLPMRQKSMKRGGGGSAANGSGSTHVQPQTSPPPPPPSVVEVHQNNSVRPGPVVPNSSPRDPPHRNHNFENGPRGSQSHIGNDHQHLPSNSHRRNNNGPHQRRDSSNHRRDQDRGGNHDWHHRNFNGRDMHMQPRGVQRNFIRSPPASPVPFVNAPPVRPFSNHMRFPDMAAPVYYVPPPEPIRGVPFFHPPPFALLVPSAPPDFSLTIMRQIEFYFSPDNLCKDTFLRKKMDEQGWVPISLVANFNRVKQHTNSIPFILDVLRNSAVVEVQGDKIRRRNDWMNWPPLPEDESPVPAPQHSGISNHDMLANRIQSVVLEGGNTSNGSISGPADHFSSHSQSSDGEGRATLQ